MTKGLQKLGPSLADQAAKTAIRLLVKKLIAESVKALIRRYFGEAVAKQVNPFVGTALSLLEFGMTVALLEGIKALNHLIDAVLIHLIRQLAEMGRQWPTFSSKFIFLEGDSAIATRSCGSGRTSSAIGSPKTEPWCEANPAR